MLRDAMLQEKACGLEKGVAMQQKSVGISSSGLRDSSLKNLISQ